MSMGLRSITVESPWSFTSTWVMSHLFQRRRFGYSTFVLISLSPRLFLPAIHHFVQRNAIHLRDLPSDSWYVAHGSLHRAPDALEGDLVVLVHKIERPVPREENPHLLPLPFDLDANALSDRGVGLLRL